MNAVALFIGYAVMVALGVLLAVVAVAYAINRAWSQLRAAIAWKHMRQAVREWQTRNPEVYARWHGKPEDEDKQG